MSLLLFGLGCLPYRTYPMLAVEEPEHRGPLEPTGLAVLDDGRLVLAAEGDARVLLVPDPDRPVLGGGALDLLPLRDGREACDGRPACAHRRFHGGLRLAAQPVAWLDAQPYNIEDLAPAGAGRVIGVAEFSTVGRKTGYRRDYTVRSRQRTERLFLLERTDAGWREVRSPEITRMRDQLSDWGRGECGDDMLVEGLARDPGGTLYFGLRRCDGPSTRVLAIVPGGDVDVYAEGIPDAGPAEGVSGLAWAGGRLYGLTAWDSYGHEVESAFGGRMFVVEEDTLRPLETFVDRPSALAILPAAAGPDTVVLFDHDARAPQRPDATVLRARVPRPPPPAVAALVDVQRAPASPPLALNGFDVRWYARDHRLAQLAVKVEQGTAGTPGAWTHAVGGLWQIRVGASLGRAASLLGVDRVTGHNRQAVALTSYAGRGLRFTSYRARLAVVPRDRERENPSVAALLDTLRPSYRVAIPLPQPLPPGAGVVLQGFEIDTAARANRGICLAALELGLVPDQGRLYGQATLVGGLCNDFDTRGERLRHGRTTDDDAAVDVILHFAVVEGGQAVPWSTAVWDRDRPSPRASLPFAGEALGVYAEDPDRAWTDELAQRHLPCAVVGPQVSFPPRAPGAPPPSWLRQGTSSTRPEAALIGASLSGFALALDPRGFDPQLAGAPLTETEALNRNSYIHRYLLRAFALPTGTFLEGGLTHGIHRGIMKDNQRPSAVLVRADLVGFAGEAPAPLYDTVWPSRARDPNQLPEDGFVRWAPSRPLEGPPGCVPAW